MSERELVPLALLRSGVPGFDEVLGGGLPEYSFNLITGRPGAGKTTLAHQMMFANASIERPALYFTVMGEPPIKILRHQQQFRFFEPSAIGTRIFFIDLSEMALDRGLGAVLARIVGEVEERSPGLVIVDSFQAIIRAATKATAGEIDLPTFVQHLAVHLTNWQATTFLVGEVADDDQRNNPLLTIADNIFTLTQDIFRSSAVRNLRVSKLRGQAPMPGLHTMRIDADGLQVFPRNSFVVPEGERVKPDGRMTTGVQGLDELVGGGFPVGDAVIISGPSGAGKSVFATQFIAAGVEQGEPGVIAVFEEHPKEYKRRATELGINLEEMERAGSVKVIYIRPLDLSPDETLYAIRQAVKQIGARRVVIDAISGFEMALAPSFREDFRESLYRLVGALTGTGITVLMTMEIVQNTTGLQFSPYIVSFLADTIILLRYLEIGGQLRKSIVIVKMRNSQHSKKIRLYEITDYGMVLRESVEDYRSSGLGMAEGRSEGRAPYPGLTEQEAVVLDVLVELREAPTEVVAQRGGFAAGPVLTAALERLVSLNYALRLTDDGRTSYRPMTQVAR
ncbi:MAG: AAA family ATPase [Herpetosiphonaceae bacterium]|nr:AAA family ATPase [Herpetosiphonaceae bacterium]